MREDRGCVRRSEGRLVEELSEGEVCVCVREGVCV